MKVFRIKALEKGKVRTIESFLKYTLPLEFLTVNLLTIPVPLKAHGDTREVVVASSYFPGDNT